MMINYLKMIFPVNGVKKLGKTKNDVNTRKAPTA